MSYATVKDGSFSIGALPPGSYELTASSNAGGSGAQPKAVLENVATGTSNVSIRLKVSAK